MPKTVAEKLQKKIGKKVKCSGACGQLKVFGEDWLMDRDRKVYCPQCQKIPEKVLASVV